MSKLCACLPRWVVKIYQEGDSCIICRKHNNEKMIWGTMCFQRSCVKTGIHIVGFEMHVKCYEKQFTELYLRDAVKMEQFVWVVGDKSYIMEHIGTVRKQLEAIGPRTGMVCANPGCENMETAKRHYDVCGHCHNEIYCSPGCQAADWYSGRHKLLCKLYQNKETPEELELAISLRLVMSPSSSNDPKKEPTCACYDRVDMHRHESMENGVCSYLGCSKKHKRFCDFHCVIVQCRVNPREKHLFQCMYCSPSCERKDLQIA